MFCIRTDDVEGCEKALVAIYCIERMHKHHAMAFSSIHCECYTQSFGINSAAGYYCNISSSSPAVPVKAVLPVRIDSSVAEINHSREAEKVHLGLALSFGRACA